MPPTYAPNHDVRDSQQRLVSPRINVSLLPTLVSVGSSATPLPAKFIGDSTVTVSGNTTGYQLNPFSDITIPCDDTAVIYAIAGSSNNNVSVLEGL
jgi:hypothetical protein